MADSIWLARVRQFALSSPGHVPPKLFRHLRSMSRHRRKLVSQRSRARNRVQKVLDRSGIRIGRVIPDVFGMNGRRIVEGLLKGLDRGVILASLSSHVSAKLHRLGEALSMKLNDADRLILEDLVCEYDNLGKHIEKFDRSIEGELDPWKKQLELLQTIPGIDLHSACAILIEIGPDLGCFPRPGIWPRGVALAPETTKAGGNKGVLKPGWEARP